MSAVPVLSKVRPADRQNAINNLCRETGASRELCTECYDASGGDFKRALLAVQARQKLQEAEARQQAEREAERVYQQQILDLQYWQAIRPALRRWMQCERFDPMQNPADAFALWEELTRRGVTMEPPTFAEGMFSVRLSQYSAGKWISGEGIGDNGREALVLAWWQIFGEGETA